MIPETPTNSVRLSSPVGRSARVWQWLDYIPHTVSSEDRANAQLLARMIVVTFVASATILCAYLLISPKQFQILDTQMIVLGWALLPVMFWFNRRGKYRTAANLYVITFIAIFTIPTYVMGASSLSLCFTAIGFFAAGLFLKGRVFRLAVSVTLLYVLVNILLNANNPYSQVSRSLTSYLIAWAFLAVLAALEVTFISHLRRVEAARREALELSNQRLRDSERFLERRVEERTAALQLATAEAEAARARAEQSDRVKSQFLASVSHELRTPLNSIINFSEFMSMGILGPINDEQRSALANIVESGHHLLALINDVLDISKIQSGSLKLYIEQNVNLQKEVDAVIEAARALLKDKPVKLEVHLLETLPPVHCDRRRILQVLLNLLSNAAKFTEEGTIIFTVARQNGHLIFIVKDSGPGIREEDQARLFQPFVQAEAGIRHTGGTGLGLAISKALVDAHQGSIGFESIHGQGAMFFVRLPIAADVPQSEPVLVEGQP